jgi:hypothetical protein
MDRARVRTTTASTTMNPSYQQQTHDLIDGLKAVCASNGLGNDGNEYKIIVQIFSHENFFPIDKTCYVKPRRSYKLLQLLRSLPSTKLNSDSAVPGLNRDSALRLPVVLPPSNVVESFDTLTDAFTQKLKTSFFENRELTQLRDWLLPLLMNGQVRVA